MKILKVGSLSIHDNSPWIPGEWRELPDAPCDGTPCGVGFHSLLSKDPFQSPVFTVPCEVWEDEREGECGRDALKTRSRRQRIVRNVTAEYPQVAALNQFVTETIPAVKWFQAQKPEPWMVVVGRAAAWAAAGDAARDAARAAAWAAARDAARAAAWDAERAWQAKRLSHYLGVEP